MRDERDQREEIESKEEKGKRGEEGKKLRATRDGRWKYKEYTAFKRRGKRKMGTGQLRSEAKLNHQKPYPHT
jgi:hypothetical protein